MKAMIMAAGYGTRLGSETRERPKILIDLGGFTVLEWILVKLKDAGCDTVIMNTHYMADRVEQEGTEIAGRVGVELMFSNERNKLLETGGGLYHARRLLGKDPFYLYNGDIITDNKLQDLYDHNITTGATATLATRDRPGERVFLVDHEGYLSGWRNRMSGEEIIVAGNINNSEIAFSAVSVIRPGIFSIMKEGKYSLRPVYLELAKERKVNTLRDDSGYWIDIGRPEGLQLCRDMVREGKINLQ